MNKMIEINSLDEYEKAIQNNSIIVFSAMWCPDCLYLKTFIDDLIQDNLNWQFYYIDRDKMIDLCIELNILGIPSFIAFKNGKEVARYVSKLRKTQEQIQDFINNIEE